MITGIFGLPGAGKSHWMTEIIFKALDRGRAVYTNVPIKRDLLSDLQNHLLVTLDFTKPDDWNHAGVYVVDEMWRFFPAGENSARMDDARREWVTLHRHRLDALGLSTEIYFGTQKAELIGPFLRELVEQSVHLKKARGLGFRNLSHFAIKEGVNGTVLKTGKKKHSQDIWKYYESHDGASAVDPEGGQVQETHVWMDWRLWMVIPALFFVWWLYSGLFDRIRGAPAPKKEPEAPAKSDTGSKPVPQNPAPVQSREAPVERELVPLSQFWRLTGWVQMGSRVFFVAEGTGGRRRLTDGCKLRPEPECSLNGYRVTLYSGRDTTSAGVESGGFDPTGGARN